MTKDRFLHSPLFLGAIGIGAGLLWAYWPVLAQLVNRWSEDPQYSHGYLVPVFALFVLWARQGASRPTFSPSWYGVALTLAGAGMYVASVYFYFTWLGQVSLLVTLAGIVWALGGGATLRWGWPAIVFLVFMIPLPGRLDGALARPLQRLATLASTNVIQTFGFPAQAEGNVIILSDTDLGIVEACSGLRMFVVFVALSTAVAMVIQRSPLQRCLIFLSAFPLALLCNVIRITVTAILHETVGHDLANYVFHDLAGWLMAPLALVFLLAELKVLSLFLEAVPDGSDRDAGPAGAKSVLLGPQGHPGPLVS